ncbi:MAG: 16S rRNA (uracil(1498)-N(3))-methyltransferase [Dysgonamonadaceae bacterium]|jgi:16S rRNA (uracil1498-N3)-methyltransferase|nr:16S rRNA (uracil(1498)-N(3))-methyltransferase [Dysgonamonadaceae bacterium]
MILFYAPEVTEIPVLPKDEAQHCLRVLRMREGDIIDLTDGKGNFYKAEITVPEINNCRLIILETIPQTKTWTSFIEIAVAPTKNSDRMEWLAEKAVEIGIDRISFIRSRFSERQEIKTGRIRKIMIAAMKQSLKSTLPGLEEIIDLDSLIRKGFDGSRFIAHCATGNNPPSLLKVYHAGNNVQVLIGPEGGFSEQEVESAIVNGIIPVSLGKSRLRTETAALVSCQTIQLIEQLHQF